MPAVENLRANLAAICEKRDISQSELARRSGIHVVTINRIFNGHMEPSIDTCEKLAEALETSLQKILSNPH